MTSATIRVLMTKSFIDSHDRAIKTIATALRDSSMEVILFDYQTPEDIVSAAVDEDVDVIGISFMSGGQVDVTTQVVHLLAEASADDIPVVVGGTIRPFDLEPLEALGVAAIFRGGERLATVAETFQSLALARRSHATR
jgi:methylmalonyl-CoA mutase cobalamin-binding domain/chain